MSVPQLSAVLAYLRWLDRVESWNGKKFPSTLNQVAQRKRDIDLYSWGGNFGNPIALPQIKKYTNSEKYRSEQIKKVVYDCNINERKAKNIANNTIPDKSAPDEQLSSQLPLANFYKLETWKPKEKEVAPKLKFKSAPPSLGVKRKGKPSSFYVHAKQGFRYWPEELRKNKRHPTRYSFGERFNPGRAGVINDRIYAKPSNNYHYWAEFEQHQKPIAGNVIAGKNKNLKS